MVVISDASPLVHLSEISRFFLLKQIYSNLVVPNAVWREVVESGGARPGANDLTAAVQERWIQIRAARPEHLQRVEFQRLDMGEREALALALGENADLVIIDELRGRAAARRVGLNRIGTLGVLIKAKQLGLVSSLREELFRIHSLSEMHLSPEVERRALELAGE
jgi:uncharacterized protein